jgi:hypothetical protein
MPVKNIRQRHIHRALRNNAISKYNACFWQTFSIETTRQNLMPIAAREIRKKAGAKPATRAGMLLNSLRFGVTPSCPAGRTIPSTAGPAS